MKLSNSELILYFKLSYCSGEVLTQFVVLKSLKIITNKIVYKNHSKNVFTSNRFDHFAGEPGFSLLRMAMKLDAYWQ